MNKKLLLEQTDQKLKAFEQLQHVVVPDKGWIHTVRSILNMSLRQLGSRLQISAQSVKELEEREASGTATLKSLREAGQALDMKLVYGYVSLHGSIGEMIEKRAFEIASEIVLRTSHNMSLEDQENSKLRLKKAIKERTEELILKRPKFLWE